MWILIATLAIVCASAACGGARPVPAEGRQVDGWPRGPIAHGPSSGSAPIFAPVGLDATPGRPHLLAVRLSLGSGAVDCVVTRGGGDVATRRVERTGESLVILPLGPFDAGVASFSLRQPKSTGLLDVELLDVTLVAVSEATASETAAEIAAAFERETGRTADAADENLIANADFASDDEVRGTPADWFAYVTTEFDAASHTLHVVGTAPGFRPFLATGPVRVVPGTRYRATWRLAVAEGAVQMRVVDYDELATVAADPPAIAGGGRVERSLEFVAPPDATGVRLRFEPAGPGASAAFDLSTVELEALPSGP